jgi:hypothetical protein
MQYNVKVNLDSSGLDSLAFAVNAESYLGAMISTLSHLDKIKIHENQIDSLEISVSAFF